MSTPHPHLDTRIHLRFLPRGAESVIQEVFDGMSPDSRFHRFLSPTLRLARAARTQLAATDGVNHVALLAETVHPSPQPVGVAHYFRTTRGRAEIALAIVDQWQGRGLGSLLLRQLADLAEECGIQELEGSVRAENLPMIRLLRAQLPCKFSHEGPGVMGFTAALGMPSSSAA